MPIFLTVSEGTLSLTKAREILQFSQILEKTCVLAICTLYTLMDFLTQRLNSMLNPLDF